jgi:hypothetical protein
MMQLGKSFKYINNQYKLIIRVFTTTYCDCEDSSL